MLPVRNNGFFLLELLLSLTAWFMLCLFLVPLLSDLSSQTTQLKVKKKAHQLLYEELQAQLTGPQTYSNYSIFDKGIEYKIIWTDMPFSGKKEACIEVDNPIARTKVCAEAE